MTITYPTWTAALALALVWFLSSPPTWLVALLASIVVITLLLDMTRSVNSAR